MGSVPGRHAPRRRGWFTSIDHNFVVTVPTMFKQPVRH